MTLPSIPLFLEEILEKTKAAGADEVDVLAHDRTSLSYSQRLGKMEKFEQSSEFEVGIRVFIGQKQALVSSTLTDKNSIQTLIDQAIAMATYVPEDPSCGLGESPSLPLPPLSLDLWEGEVPTEKMLEERARMCEEAALSVAGITNSGGATAGWNYRHTYLANTKGFEGSYEKATHSLSMEAIGGHEGEMEASSAHTQAIYKRDLEPPEQVGERASRTALSHLNPRKIPSTLCPVVYSPLISQSLLSHFCTAINGDSLVRGVTFLKDRMGDSIFSSQVTIRDDPLKERGLRSRPFDSEGWGGQPRLLVDKGVLRSWILDHRTSRHLHLPTTGHGSRGVNSIPFPTPSNVILEKGPSSPQALIQSLSRGVFITDLMGSAINPITGDYSRGAKGFWIEGGQISYPIHEITLSGNLLDMFQNLHVADDLTFRYGIDAPTLMIEEMSISGK